MTPPRSRSILPWVVALMIGLLPWAYTPWPTRAGGQDFRWPLVALGLFVGALIHVCDSRRDISPRPSPFREPSAIAFALITIGLLLSALLSPAPRLGLKIGLREAIFAGWMLLLARRVWSEREASIPLIACIVTSTAEAILTLWQRFAPGSSPWTAPGVTGRSAMCGTLGNPEYVAGLIACGLAATVAFAANRQTPRSVRLAAWLASAPMSLAIILGGGRGAALGSLIALATLFLLNSNSSAPVRSLRRIVPIVACLILLLAVFAAIRVAGGSDAQRQSLGGRMLEVFDPRSVSTRDRLGLWSISSGMVAAHPLFGCGPGLFGAEFDRARAELSRTDAAEASWLFNETMNDHNAPEAHSDPLQWWAEYGLLPLLGLALACASAFGLLFANRSRLFDSILGPWLACFTALFVSSLVSFPLHRPERALIFWTALGIIHGLARSGSPASTHTSTQTDSPRISTG